MRSGDSNRMERIYRMGTDACSISPSLNNLLILFGFYFVLDISPTPFSVTDSLRTKG